MVMRENHENQAHRRNSDTRDKIAVVFKPRMIELHKSTRNKKTPSEKRRELC
jgi:hypothetical protein